MKSLTQMLPKLIVRRPARVRSVFLAHCVSSNNGDVSVDTLHAVPAGPSRQCKSRHELQEHMLTGSTFLTVAKSLTAIFII